MHTSSSLMEEGEVGEVLAEAVGDVPVEEVDLTRCVYAILYRTSLEGVVELCARGASCKWLRQLLARRSLSPHQSSVGEVSPMAEAWVRGGGGGPTHH